MNGAQDIVLFDGDCAFCNGWVRWISKRDRKHRYRFVPLGSEEGLALRNKHAIPADTDSIVLVRGEGAHVRSAAAWRVLMGLPGWQWAGGSLALVPAPLRNWGYDLIAKNRHRLGMADKCELP